MRMVQVTTGCYLKFAVYCKLSLEGQAYSAIWRENINFQPSIFLVNQNSEQEPCLVISLETATQSGDEFRLKNRQFIMQAQQFYAKFHRLFNFRQTQCLSSIKLFPKCSILSTNSINHSSFHQAQGENSFIMSRAVAVLAALSDSGHFIPQES